LARHNEKRATAERLLVEALNDLVSGIADTANGVAGAQARYASATSRVGLHGSRQVAAAFRRFQEHGTTGTTAGRDALIEAMQAARRELGLEDADADDLAILLFGAGRARDERS
jgi:hypothetical protein